MNIKILLPLALLTFGYFSANAQNPDLLPISVFTESRLSIFDNAISDFNNVINSTTWMEGDNSLNIKGSPYENASFIIGKAANKKTKKSQPYYLRYNIYNDIIEIKDTDNTKGLIKSLNIYAIINNKEYHYEIYLENNSTTNEGYFILLNKGINSNLYLRKTKTFKNKEASKDAYRKATPASFIDSEAYYIKKDRVLLPFPKNKKSLFQLFPENENELKKFIKKEKNNFRLEKDIVKLFIYNDSLLN